MPQKVYNNIEDYRILWDGQVVEDVTSVTLPSIARTSTSIDASGMVAAVDVPSMYHVDAMDASVAHNNGMNCEKLRTPGKHTVELRLARQRYSVAQAEIGFDSVKYRMVVLHKGGEEGSVERNNPLGATENFSVIRYEKEIAGQVVELVDAMSGQIEVNGMDYASPVQSLLN